MEVRDIIRRLVRNAALIFGGRLVFGVLNMISSALVVRTHGLDVLGLVVLLQVYVRFFSEAIKFESWQVVLTYGAGAFEKNKSQFQRLLGFTFAIDVLSVAMGIALGLALMSWAADVFDWPPDVASFAPFFLFSLPFVTQGTPNGVLRLADRIDALAWQHGINASVRFAGVLLTLLVGAGTFGLVLAWFAGSVLSGCYQWYVALRELLNRHLCPVISLNLRRSAREFPGIWRFLTFSNLTTTLSMVYNTGSTLLMGGLLGASAAGTLQIAQQIASAIGKPVRQLGPIISPEFAKLASAGEWRTFRRLILRQIAICSLISAVAGFVILILLSQILKILYGEEILKDIWLFRILILNALISMIFFSFTPALLSAAKAGTVLLLHVASALVYTAVTVSLAESWGVLAVGFGTLAAMLVSYPLNLIVGSRLLRKRVQRSSRPNYAPGLAGVAQTSDPT